MTALLSELRALADEWRSRANGPRVKMRRELEAIIARHEQPGRTDERAASIREALTDAEKLDPDVAKKFDLSFLCHAVKARSQYDATCRRLAHDVLTWRLTRAVDRTDETAARERLGRWIQAKRHCRSWQHWQSHDGAWGVELYDDELAATGAYATGTGPTLAEAIHSALDKVGATSDDSCVLARTPRAR